MERLNSSLRIRAAAETLPRAQAMASRLGITRVTDATRLDTIGIPVFVSIRPDALLDGVCVSAGKGLMPVEAQVGAYMEAIECAIVERRGHVGSRAASPHELLGGDAPPSVLADLCPVHGKGTVLGGRLDCIPAEDLISGSDVLIPTELIAVPYTPEFGDRIFGATSNGLASGNDADEATLHGLFEVIERDVRSFHLIRDTAVPVVDESLPANALNLVDCVRSAGFSVLVRSLPNVFDLPVFDTYILDLSTMGPALARGVGCHAVPEIALVRAVTEAAQNRATNIHGGRGDYPPSIEEVRRARRRDVEVAAKHFAAMTQAPETIWFEDVRSSLSHCGSITEALNRTLECLTRHGIEHVCRVTLTSGDEEMQVVRVVVPKLEYFQPDLPRLGPRLVHWMLSHAS